MAIVQISRITQRKGLQENLPQLAGAEFGWSIDERRLFIGNGTLQEGAPVIGNTEILTEFSDIFEFQSTYTYKGEAAGYVVQTGPTSGTPVTQSLQSWLDQFATVKDFGAVGDGIADDTAAINRALYQLFCREVNPQIRRSLFFPAGVYRVTETINIPTYATLYGEGIDNTIIRLDDSTDDSTLNAYVARTADSLQQVGVNIETNSATAPAYITISNMGFENLDPTTDVFLVEDAANCRFQNVSFTGPLAVADLNTDGADTAGVRFGSTPSLISSQIVFDGCEFSGTTYGINTDQQVQAITVTNSKFNTLYKGVVLGAVAPINGGPTGFKITQNFFDNIFAEGIVFGDVQLNASGYNIFYDVANHFDGTLNPATYVIDIQQDNNVSVGDMFERADAFATTWPRVYINGTTSIAMTNSSQLALGSYVRETGDQATLINNVSSATTIFTVDTATVGAFCINYTIVRDTSRRTGSIMVANQLSGGTPVFTDDYVENSSTGIALSLTETSTTTSFRYTSSNTGIDGTITYSVTRLV
jgi:hypothetical protein